MASKTKQPTSQRQEPTLLSASPWQFYLKFSSCSRALCLGSDSLNPLKHEVKFAQLHLPPRFHPILSSSSYSVSMALVFIFLLLLPFIKEKINIFLTYSLP